jgi:hypothetical protein
MGLVITFWPRFQKMFVKEKDEIFGLKVVLLTCFAGQNNVENCYSVVVFYLSKFCIF